MIVFIEGCDRTGKSTLAQKLKEALNAELIHTGKPKTDDPFMEYMGQLLSFYRTQNYVLDRGYLGEFVYSRLWRDGCKINGREFHILDMVAASHQAIVIHAHASTEDIIERCRKEGEELLKEDQIDKCKALFQEIMEWTTLPVIQYDSSSMKPEDLVRIVKQYQR